MRELPSAGEEQSIEAARALREHDKKEEKEEEEEKESLASPPRATGASARSAAPTKASESARCALLGSRSLSLSHSLSKTERGRRRERIRLCCCSGEGKKNKKALGGERSYKTFSTPSFSHTFRHAARPPRLERAGQRAQRQGHKRGFIDAPHAAARSEETTAAAAAGAAPEMLRQRRRRNPFDKGEEGRRRRSENDEEEEEGDSEDVFFVFVFFSCWRGRDQRLCRGCWRRLRSNFFVVVVDLDISSFADNGDALVAAVGPLAPGLQAQAREGRALPVPHGREELHARDGAR